MEKAIALYQKSLEESAAKAAAENSRVHATEATERVVTARESEVAKRRKTVEILIAEKQAEETRIAAEAEPFVRRSKPRGSACSNEAENVLTDQARYSLFRRKLLDRIEGIGVKRQADGKNRGHPHPPGGRPQRRRFRWRQWAQRYPTRSSISALRYRVQAPLIDSILADIGVEGGSLARMPGLIREARDIQGIQDTAARKGGESKPAAPAPSPPARGEPRAERTPRKKE